ncbi:hypothetical protein DAEQUDRAFT_409500 [Daedalea quercina L-15889]|uniref:Uncharacterized protein n=1 Tax=Daedalea quercina L-15889 TaxID=1314783 RepID=A0A165NKB4_9APHY|nr:hypothetical protein DAEQUDRAFT_409500 [Daedalea quercina L-15889]
MQRNTTLHPSEKCFRARSSAARTSLGAAPLHTVHPDQLSSGCLSQLRECSHGQSSPSIFPRGTPIADKRTLVQYKPRRTGLSLRWRQPARAALARPHEVSLFLGATRIRCPVLAPGPAVASTRIRAPAASRSTSSPWRGRPPRPDGPGCCRCAGGVWVQCIARVAEARRPGMDASQSGRARSHARAWTTTVTITPRDGGCCCNAASSASSSSHHHRREFELSPHILTYNTRVFSLRSRIVFIAAPASTPGADAGRCAPTARGG